MRCFDRLVVPSIDEGRTEVQWYLLGHVAGEIVAGLNLERERNGIAFASFFFYCFFFFFFLINEYIICMYIDWKFNDYLIDFILWGDIWLYKNVGA